MAWNLARLLAKARAAIARGSGNLTPEEKAELRVLGDRVEKAVKARLTHNGTLTTLSDFEATFARNVVGWWDSADVGFTYSPADRIVGFSADGTGSVSVGLLGELHRFRWREADVFTIDLSDEEGQRWVKVTWRFSQDKEGVILHLDEGPADAESLADEEERDWDETDAILLELTFDRFRYAGPASPS